MDVLSIDDDPEILHFISHVLGAQHYEVHTLKSGTALLDFIDKEPQNLPDMIYLDVNMPGMNGLELCQKLQKHPVWSLVPIVFLTALEDNNSRLMAFQAGAVGFMSKPINQTTLIKTTEKYTRISRAWRKEFHQPERLEAGKTVSQANHKTTSVATLSGFKGFLNFIELHIQGSQLDKIYPRNLYAQCLNHGLSSEQVSRLIAGYLKKPLLETGVDAESVRLGVLPTAFCRQNNILPIKTPENQDAFLLSNPFSFEVEELLSRHPKTKQLITRPENIESLLQGKPLTLSEGKIAIGEKSPKQVSTSEVEHIVGELQEKYLQTEDLSKEEISDEHAAPIIRLVNRLIEKAYQMGSSDIHIIPREDKVEVRYRIDGALRTVTQLTPPSLIQPIVTRIKIMSQLDISEKRLPQDGRIAFKQFGKTDVDLRVATAPIKYGEQVVMRVIDKQKSLLSLEDLGFSAYNLQRYRAQIRQPYGMILHVGPTGSGKSMTLYAALGEINNPEINVQTAEDPIEYSLEGIQQLQVKPQIGLSFARALRAFLRLDPDVILVGEIRDHETAEIAIEASLTGHLLLSTLHTNDAPSTLTRFMEMGIPAYMISGSVLVICAQRLIRRLCSECKQADQLTPEELQILGKAGKNPFEIFRPVGCPTCDGTGYKGRMGVHEVLVPSDELRQIINQPGMTAEALKKAAVAEGMVTLFWDGMEKVRAGQTAFEEVIAKLKPDEFDACPDHWFQAEETATSHAQ